jgi:5-methylcytosine-specific restriction endonuclease McrA
MRVMITRHCARCRVVFGSGFHENAFICAACFPLARAAADSEGVSRVGGVVIRPCAHCGIVFTRPGTSAGYGRYCTVACWKAPPTERVQTSARRQYVRRRDAVRERVDWRRVFARDRWRCQLCGGSTPLRLRGTPHPEAPELDHILPIAAGGLHTYANTQCVCRACNAWKGARPLGQLRLL